MSPTIYPYIDYESEYQEKFIDITHKRASRKKYNNQARKRIEKLEERKKLRKEIGMDDEYWAKE